MLDGGRKDNECLCSPQTIDAQKQVTYRTAMLPYGSCYDSFRKEPR